MENTHIFKTLCRCDLFERVSRKNPFLPPRNATSICCE